MEIVEPIQQDVQDTEAHKIKATWVKGGVRQHFSKPNDLVNVLEELVLALNWNGDYRQLIEALPHFSDNLDLTSFLNVMAAIGYNNESAHMHLNKIPNSFLPCLFIPDSGAAMAIISKDDKANSVVVVEGDSGVGKSIELSSMHGTVYHFTLFDIDKAVATKQNESFKESFHRFRPLIAQIFILTLVYNIFVAMVPLYIMLIYDKVIPSQSITMAFSLLVGILIFLFSAQILDFARTKILAYIGARMDKTIGEAIIRHLLYLSPSYTEGNTVGIQIARIKSFDNIRDFFTSNIAIMACEFPFAAVFLGIIFALGGWIGFVPVILGLIFYAIYHVANPIVNKYIRIQAAQYMLKQSFLLETFTRDRDIKETGRNNVWVNKFNEMLVNLAKNGFDNAFYNSVLSIVSELFMMLAALSMLVFGAVTAMYGNLSLGALIAIMMLTWKVLNPMKSFFASLPKIEQIANSISQVNKLFSIPTEQTTERVVVVNDAEKAKIEFNRVTFKYRPELSPAILGVSFVVQPGELICVTGKNSSGKSTMLRLILGLYKPQAGSVLINDMNIQQFDPIELRHTISYMPQHVQLFYGTIKQNILLGNMIATDEQVQAAAMLAGVHDDIMRLPEQYDTRVGDQRSQEFPTTFLQLIALARTYLKKSSIMLLDEPATGFDEVTERKFIDVINLKRKECTILWVTHRPSHLKIADKILYMEAGEVALFGDATKVLERLPRSLL